MTPDQADPLTTALIGTNVMFSWVEPDSRGAAIVSYNVYIQTSTTLSTGLFILSSQYCNQIA